VADAANPAQQAPEPRPTLGVALDVDLGERPDALLAIAMLNGLSAQKLARRIALSVTRPSLVAAQLADVIAEYYSTLPLNWGYATIGLPEGGMRDGALSPDSAALAALLARKNLDGALLYPTRVQRLVDTADSATLIRNLLLAEPDGSAALVLAGAATGLSRLLDLYGAVPQLRAKVKLLVVAAGAYPAGNVEPTIAGDVRSARRVFNEWPTPIVAVGAELGEALRLPAKVVQEMLAATPEHPVAAAYAALGRMRYDTATTALAALLYAARPDAEDYRLSEPGTIVVLDDGRTRFTPRSDGRHRYLIANPARAQQLLAQYSALVSAPPLPRPVVQRKPPMPPAQAGAAQQPAVQPGAAQPSAAKPR
jgi:purine nucleosidase